jgi:hypothetical protein
MNDEQRESFFDALARGLGSALHRRLMALLAIVLVTMMVVAAPALADTGGDPHEGSCGLGTGLAHEVIQDDTAPGASELTVISPSEFGCSNNV